MQRAQHPQERPGSCLRQRWSGCAGATCAAAARWRLAGSASRRMARYGASGERGGSTRAAAGAVRVARRQRLPKLVVRHLAALPGSDQQQWQQHLWGHRQQRLLRLRRQQWAAAPKLWSCTPPRAQCLARLQFWRQWSLGRLPMAPPSWRSRSRPSPPQQAQRAARQQALGPWLLPLPWWPSQPAWPRRRPTQQQQRTLRLWRPWRRTVCLSWRWSSPCRLPLLVVLGPRQLVLRQQQLGRPARRKLHQSGRLRPHPRRSGQRILLTCCWSASPASSCPSRR